MAIKKKLLIAATVSINGIGENCRNQQIFFVCVVSFTPGEALRLFSLK
jgi:hypothetical protein